MAEIIKFRLLLLFFWFFVLVSNMRKGIGHLPALRFKKQKHWHVTQNHLLSDNSLTLYLLLFLAAIKVNCQGSCGISSKANDSTWTVEEQYFNSTLSVADKGNNTLLNNLPSHSSASLRVVYIGDVLFIIHPLCARENGNQGCLEIKKIWSIIWFPPLGCDTVDAIEQQLIIIHELVCNELIDLIVFTFVYLLNGEK